MRLLPLLLALGFVPGICLAQATVGPGDWCLVLDETHNCNFNSADACYAAADVNGGYCKKNARKPLVAGTGRWCVVSAAGRDCKYRIQSSCLRRAREIKGGCVQNTEKALENAQIRNKYSGFFNPDFESAEQDLLESLREAQGQ